MAIRAKSSDFKTDSTGKYPYITEGGESEIYRYDKGHVLKKFKSEANLSLKLRTIQLWLKCAKIDGLIVPIDSLEINSKIQGYLMDEVSDAEDIKMLSNKKYLKTNSITSKQILKVLIECSERMELCHKQNGNVIGDINDKNFLIKLCNQELISYFIDTDSYGFLGKVPAAMYTALFTDPNAFKNSGMMELTQDTDKYAFAVLAFKCLTRIHPFGGSYEKDEKMDPTVRMKKKISVLGNHKIIIPPMISSWEWMSPELKQTFLDIFENEKRVYMTDMLKELYQNLSYCKKHKTYYYAKFDTCPLCNTNAKVDIMPKIVAPTKVSGISIRVILDNPSVQYILDKTKYMDFDGNIVHCPSKMKWKKKNGCIIEFTEDGKYVLEIYHNRIEVYQSKDSKHHNTILRASKSSYSIVGDTLYYIDEKMNFSQITFENFGDMKNTILKVPSNSIFEVASNHKYLIGLLFPKRMLIAMDDTQIFLDYEGRISNYAVKYDKTSDNWLFIYETYKGEHRTILFGRKNAKVREILFDSKVYKYMANPLSNITFANNTIYAPTAGKIMGINWKNNKVVPFDCNVVTEESSIEFSQKGFNIINEDKIYYYGG